MFVSAPESTTGVAFAKTRVHFKHFSGGVRLEHDLGVLNRVFFGDVDLEVDMVFSEAEFAELKAKAFQVVECLGAGVDVALFSEVSVSVMCGEHHGDPVVSCVSRWLFIATAIYIFHTIFAPVAPVIGQADACRVRQKEKLVDFLKRDATFHLRVITAVQTAQYSQSQL